MVLNRHWQFHDLPNEVLVEAARRWVEEFNVSMLGGCCGIGPDHIRALKVFCDETKPPTA